MKAVTATARNTTPRLILIFGCRSAGDMIKVLALGELDRAFNRALRVAARRGRRQP